MYAIIVTGGKQYKVSPGLLIKIEKLNESIGDKVVFDHILAISNGTSIDVGKPYIPGMKIIGEITEHGRDKKINVIKFRRRKHYMKRYGHRQYYTTVKISEFDI